MVIAENQYGSIAPTISPMKTLGVKTSTVEISARLTKAPKRARDTKAAEPMAKPYMHKIMTMKIWYFENEKACPTLKRHIFN